MRFGICPPELFERIFDEVFEMVGEIMKNSDGSDTLEHVISCLKGGSMSLWVEWDDVTGMPDGICITYNEDRPAGKVLNIYMVNGRNPMNWAGHVKIIEEYAKSCGCFMVALCARPAFQKLYTPLGYGKSHVMLYKKLED